MSDLISRQAAIDAIFGRSHEIIKMRIGNLPSVQPDRELIEQLKWERDTAIQQLKDLGYGLGEKPKTDDTISRQAAIDCMMRLQREDEEAYGASIPEGFDGDRAAEALMQLPSVQPDNDMIHLQKEQAYLQGWEEGREALRKEMWEDGRDRLD